MKRTKLISSTISKISEINNKLENAKEMHEKVINSRSKEWQGGENGRDFKNYIDSLEGAIDCLDSALTKLKNSTV